jgi:hypothetical protein
VSATSNRGTEVADKGQNVIQSLNQETNPHEAFQDGKDFETADFTHNQHFTNLNQQYDSTKMSKPNNLSSPLASYSQRLNHIDHTSGQKELKLKLDIIRIKEKTKSI